MPLVLVISMSKIPLVSIIIPVYNVGEYLTRCLESCLLQQYSNTEIIAVDDGSADNSGEILDLFCQLDARVKVVHKKNGGVTSAREEGISIATGEYLFFLDGDDYIPKNAIKDLVVKALETNADIIAADYAFVDEHGQVSEKRTFSFEIVSPETYYPLIFRNHQIYLCFKLVRRSLYRRVQVPLEITLGEDAICFVQLVRNAAKIAKCDQIVYYYCRRSNSVTMSLRRKDLIMAYEASEWIFSYMMRFPVNTALELELKKYRLMQVLLYLKRTPITGFYRNDVRAVLRYCFLGAGRRSLNLNRLDYLGLQVGYLHPWMGAYFLNSTNYLKRTLCKILGRV